MDVDKIHALMEGTIERSDPDERTIVQSYLVLGCLQVGDYDNPVSIVVGHAAEIPRITRLMDLVAEDLFCGFRKVYHRDYVFTYGNKKLLIKFVPRNQTGKVDPDNTFQIH